MTVPICPMCGEDGVHPAPEDCAAALRVAIRQCVDRLRRLPLDDFVARWTAYGRALLSP